MKLKDVESALIFYRVAAVALRRAGSSSEADVYRREADRLSEKLSR